MRHLLRSTAALHRSSPNMDRIPPPSIGNPNAHNLDALIYGRVLARRLARNIYTATTVDQMPKYVSAGLMFGSYLSIPVPDLDRTAYLLALGANRSPQAAASRRRLMRAAAARHPGRGGRIVVIDPRSRTPSLRTSTASSAHWSRRRFPCARQRPV